MKLSARRFCRILHHLSQNPGRKDAEQARLDGAVHINLPATFQFSPATSKSIDIPVSTFKYEYFACTNLWGNKVHID